jgi:hypothetical protein
MSREADMGHRVTLDLPEDVAERAQEIARRTHRSVEAVLLDWLDHAMTDVPVEALPDDQVLALRDLQMSTEQQTAMSDLLAQQREGHLTDEERLQLDELLSHYRRGMVRKARALKVAVDRGLQSPLSAD